MTLDLRLDPQVRATDRRRGHRFQPPKADLAKVPALYATEHVPAESKTVGLHYFVGSWDWWIVEVDPDTFQAFGFVRSHMEPRGEWGNVDLLELSSAQMTATVNGRPFRQPVERDCWWTPGPASEVIPGYPA